MPVEKQVMVLYAATHDFLDNVPVEKVREWEKLFLDYMDTTRPDIGQLILENKIVTPEIEELLQAAITDFGMTFSP